MPFSSKVRASASSSAGQLVLLDGGEHELANERREPALEGGDVFLDRSRASAHLEDRTGEEAAARERAPGEVGEERVAHGDELSESGRSVEGRGDDLLLEDPLGLVDGRQLQLLLRSEVGVDAALAHLERRGQVADRQAFEAVEGRQRDGLTHDRFAGALPVEAPLPFGLHVDKIARSVVLSHLESTTDRSFSSEGDRQ